MARRCSNWIKTLLTYVEDTEAPRDFWVWGGIFTLASALQRRVWLPYGLENIYPNLFILIVAPPASRKAGPPTLARKMLDVVEVPMAVDSSSKRSMTQELASLGKMECYADEEGLNCYMSTFSVISNEMSSLLAVDPKGVIEVLTDLYDCPDNWKYKTKGEGHDYLYNCCVSMLACTTPTWLANNLPEEAVGGGFTSRCIILPDTGIYKPVPIPPPLDEALKEELVADLRRIRFLKGPFIWGEGAREYFENWYITRLPELRKQTKDERAKVFIGRMHVTALKVAIALRIAYSDELVLTTDDLGHSVEMMERVLIGIPKALGGHGRSRLGPETHKLMLQIRSVETIELRELLAMNMLQLTYSDLKEILDGLEASGLVSRTQRQDESGKTKIFITWKGGKEALG